MLFEYINGHDKHFSNMDNIPLSYIFQHTEIVQIVFATYFRILKRASQSLMLPSVLEGLAKFAHLINVEFFDDLIHVLHNLVERGVRVCTRKFWHNYKIFQSPIN